MNGSINAAAILIAVMLAVPIPVNAEDFTFRIPINFSITCDKTVVLRTACLVGDGEFGWPEEVVNEGTDRNAPTWKKRNFESATGNIVGGTTPAFPSTDSDLGMERQRSMITYENNGQAINTTATIKFNALPDRHPSEAKQWKCYTVMEAHGDGQPSYRFIVPGSVTGLPGSGSPLICGLAEPGAPLVVYHEGTLPEN